MLMLRRILLCRQSIPRAAKAQGLLLDKTRRMDVSFFLPIYVTVPWFLFLNFTPRMPHAAYILLRLFTAAVGTLSAIPAEENRIAVTDTGPFPRTAVS